MSRKDKVRSPTPSCRSFMSQFPKQESRYYFTHTHNPHPTL